MKLNEKSQIEIDKLNAMSFIDCDICHGWGMHNSLNGKIKCETCNGKGKIDLLAKFKTP